MILTGNSLGKRQQDLNSKVNNAATKNIPLEEFNGDGDSDVYNLFKIDLASKYKNVNYIVETLKCGDGLYISRAMKCLWIYNTEFEDYINPDYLHHKVFPFMSTKMKKKFLTTISTYVRKEERTLAFYQYCMNVRLGRFAFKFLISTSLEFRIDMIKNNFSAINAIMENEEDIVYLVGDNFTLAELYQDKISEHRQATTWFIFSHLYSVDAERYLSKWEKYFDANITPRTQLGLRMSKDIMLKHKSRLLNYIQFYYKLVNTSMLCKYTTIEEAKLYTIRLLPNSSEDYWFYNYSTEYKAVLDLIPAEGRYVFMKNTFEAKYPSCEFEKSSKFYERKYYNFMSVEERESWALRHLANPNKSFLSECEDKEYLWYRFVNYDKALPGIKKYVLITPDARKRADIVNVLIQSTRNQDQLQKLFQYYYERHANADRSVKERFLSEVIEHNLVWEFDEHCWASFNKLLLSIELYNPMDHQFSHQNHDLIMPVLFYHVLHNKEFPEGLKLIINSYNFFNQFYHIQRDLCRISNQEQEEKMFQYLKQLCIHKIKTCLDSKLRGDDHEVEIYVRYIKNLLKHFNKPDEELPEIVLKFIKFVRPEKISQRKMIRLLKQDAQSVLSKIPLLDKGFSNSSDLKISTLLRKIKVYFSNDLAQDFLKYFSESLSRDIEYKNLFAAVHGIFLLADKQFKTEFMLKYVPNDPKIDHNAVDRKHLYIQEAICRFACYSRPPVPLETIRMYIKGDYVHFCLPLMYMYGANLPQQTCLQFVEVLIDAPVSVQKHGLRLAFQCSNYDQLKKIVLKIWARSKNISLRMVIYTYLFNHMFKRNDDEKLDLFKILSTLTSEINEEDHDDVINILTSGVCDGHELPNNFKTIYFKTAWITVNQFSDDNINLARKAAIIKTIIKNISWIDYNVVHQIVDDYLIDIFIKKHIIPNRKKFNELYMVKFDLTTTFIAKYDDDENIKHGLKFVQFILTKCYEMWQDTENQHFSRSYCHTFIHNLDYVHFELRKKNNMAINVIFEYIAQTLRENSPMHEIFLLLWRLRIVIITNDVLDTGYKLNDDTEENVLKKSMKMYATEVLKVVKEYAHQGEFHLTLLENISEIVVHFVDIIKDSLVSSWNIDFDALTIVAVELVNFKTTESMFMAINILPITPSRNAIEEHEYVIENIRKFEIFEVQALFYQKFVNSRVKKDVHCWPKDEEQ